ncbi:DNA repair protein RAD50-like isoform X2 [Asparagus officinalis]|uniref:DNA repair protein RAD50-like isoform X2 n=1 Tax=Asparagus officinalis TaxID=4686 RepID=UPI00098E12B5|nr:DNA repair protein RAD50-like isoform X2 [Asparagus officinalis]
MMLYKSSRGYKKASQGSHEIKTYKLKLENLQTLKDAAHKLRDSISQEQEKSESLKAQIKEMERNIQGVEDKILHTETTLKELQKLLDQISTSTTARSTLFKLQQTQYVALAEENEDTDDELKEWQSKFEERIALLQSKISKLEREMNDEETRSSTFSQTINESMREIGKLQAKADLMLTYHRGMNVIQGYKRLLGPPCIQTY